MPSSECVKPRTLKRGDTIGVVAPASPFDREKFERGVAVLQEMGFVLRLAPDLFDRDGFLAGSDRQRADQLTWMFLDDDIAAVMCARGGYGSIRLLELLDWKRIAARPKIFIGFSDITTLHVAIRQRCGWVTFHGPTVTTLGLADEKTIVEFKRSLLDPALLMLTVEEGRTIRSGVAEGLLIGGNLTTLNHLVGTTYADFCRGRILLIEDIGEAPYRIDRMLTQMRMAGVFEGLGGLMVGQFKDCGPAEELYRIIDDCFGGMPIPISAGWTIGHETRNTTVPLGVTVRLDADRGELRFLEPATRSQD